MSFTRRAAKGGRATPAQLPSIRGRLAQALLFWAVVWGIAVAAAVWLGAREEVDELLDDALQSSAELLSTLLNGHLALDAAGPGPVQTVASNGGVRFAWQAIDADGRVRMRSSRAPEQAFSSSPVTGFRNVPEWRVFGIRLGNGGHLLYVAQTRAERIEAEAEVAFSAALATLATGVLGTLWLRIRVGRELAPLQALSERLAQHEPLDPLASLGPAERQELQPVQAAIDELGRRLARRIANERAFSAHAAHALRTPLAGIDAQLAIALRECDPAIAPRLKRVRQAAGRLQRVVAALLGLFRAGVELRRGAVDLNALLLRLPVEALTVEVRGPASVDADPDLLAAALLNLLDNALRHGASRVVLSVPRPGVVRLHDDGPGASAAHLRELQAALDGEHYEGRTGLGLLLADRVARSHGGALALLSVAKGFAVEVGLTPAG